MRIRAPASERFFLFGNQLNAGDPHRFVHGLAHVIDSQSRDGYRRQRLHFDTRLRRNFGGTGDGYPILAFRKSKTDFAMHEGQGMAERNQFAGFLRRHDASQPRRRQHIALGHGLCVDPRQRRLLQPDFPGGNSRPQHHRFAEISTMLASPRALTWLSFFIFREIFSSLQPPNELVPQR